jgi:hypothetical protein
MLYIIAIYERHCYTAFTLFFYMKGSFMNNLNKVYNFIINNNSVLMVAISALAFLCGQDGPPFA